MGSLVLSPDLRTLLSLARYLLPCEPHHGLHPTSSLQFSPLLLYAWQFPGKCNELKNVPSSFFHGSAELTTFSRENAASPSRSLFCSTVFQLHECRRSWSLSQTYLAIALWVLRSIQAVGSSISRRRGEEGTLDWEVLSRVFTEVLGEETALTLRGR